MHLCFCHTIPKFLPDGHTIKDFFIFGCDRKHIKGHLKPSFDRRWGFSGFGSNFVRGGKVFGMQNNCPKTLRRLIVEGILYNSYHLRLYLWSSVPLDISFTKTIGSTHFFRKSTRLVKPLQCRRVVIVLYSYYSGIQMGPWCPWRQPYLSSSSVSYVYR